VTLVLPYLPIAGLLGFAPLSAGLIGLLMGLTILLLLVSEVAKRFFFRHHALTPGSVRGADGRLGTGPAGVGAE
jgi:hypothetical protein